jgi:putative aldouronate transport system substrate-binding protein
MKKILTTGILMSVLVLLAACGGGNAEDDTVDTNTQEDAQEVATEGFPIVEEPITMELMAPGTGMAEWEDMPTMQTYEEMTNIEFDYNTPPLNDFATNFNLAFASGDVPDVIFGVGEDDFTAAMQVDYGNQGLILPLNDLIDEYAPNLSQIMEERPEVRQAVTTPDGNIYALPNVLPVEGEYSASWIRGPVWINGEWMDALGIEEVPQTLDEFYNMLVRFRDEDPNGNGEADEIPMTDVQMDSTRPWLLSAFGIKEWGIEEHDGQVRYAPMTENYRGYLEFMNTLYQENLLDEEVFSQQDEQKKSKGEDNRLGVFPDWFSYFTTGQSEEEAMVNPMMGPMTSEYSEEPLFPMSTGINRGVFAIGQNNPNPAATMRWVDYFYSPEGNTFLNQGPAGHLWEWEDAEGSGEPRVYASDLAPEDREELRGQITPDYGITTPGYKVTVNPIGGEETTPFTEFLEGETENKILEHGEVPYPQVYLTSDEQETVSGIETDLQTYVRNSEAQFITGQTELNDDTWNDYVSTIENMNVDEYVSVYQAAYDRYEEAAE